jgi:hypothetical protein
MSSEVWADSVMREYKTFSCLVIPWNILWDGSAPGHTFILTHHYQGSV